MPADRRRESRASLRAPPPTPFSSGHPGAAPSSETPRHRFWSSPSASGWHLTTLTSPFGIMIPTGPAVDQMRGAPAAVLPTKLQEDRAVFGDGNALMVTGHARPELSRAARPAPAAAQGPLSNFSASLFSMKMGGPHSVCPHLPGPPRHLQPVGLPECNTTAGQTLPVPTAEAGRPRPEGRRSQGLVWAQFWCREPSSCPPRPHEGEGQRSSPGSFIKALIPLMRAPPRDLPPQQAPPPHTVTSGLRF